MAIDRKIFNWLSQFKAKRILTLGRQHWCVKRSKIKDRDFADKHLGGEVDSLDASPDESPTFVHDLNNPLPAELLGKYDLVFDGGTIEHVFDPLAALDHAASAVATGGVFASHQLLNYAGHGFWGLSPELFYRWSVSRGFVGQMAATYRLGPMATLRPIPFPPRGRIEISSVLPVNLLFACTRGSNSTPVQASPSLAGPLRHWLWNVRAWAK